MKSSIDKYKKTIGFLLAAFLLTGCVSEKPRAADSGETDPYIVAELNRYDAVEFTVEPETLLISIKNEGNLIPLSLPGQKKAVENFKEEEDGTSWEYPEEGIAVSVRPGKDYLTVELSSVTEKDNEFEWPSISGEMYYLPLGEGKRIPGEDEAWNRYLRGREFSVLENLSMPFWSTVNGDYSVMYIMEDPYRSKLVFTEEGSNTFQAVHEYPEIDKDKDKRFRIYLTDNDPVSSAKLYRQYKKEQGSFVSLEQKADQNPNVRKLYGAPHIYLWGEFLIAPEDINWAALRDSLDNPVWKQLEEIFSEPEDGAEFIQVLNKIKSQDYVDEYQKNVICRSLSTAMKQNGLYEPESFARQVEVIKQNKQDFATALPGVFKPVEEWMEKGTVDLIGELKKAGLDRAWIGLNSWEQAFAKPELIETAVSAGYLTGSYDSYHSIHRPGKEEWVTAEFPDETLYESATVTDKNGIKLSGFQNVGRKLNPTLSISAVEDRVGGILSAIPSFNSWFIDCDATGEVYDDYTPEHRTTIQEDIKARLFRMSMIRDNYDLVIGSEGGNDYAASTIAFAHGIELPTFSYLDEDMKKNKESQYYIGNYFSATGGVADHFARQIPVKEEYRTVFLDPRFDVPLFKLVYNDSVITSYHWDWSTFKVQGETETRMIREVLYNVPPLYHLDNAEWVKYGKAISSHTKIWSEFSQKAVQLEMTDFQYLTEEGEVQQCSYEDGLSAVANFGEVPYVYKATSIPARSVLIMNDAGSTVYTPEL